jgi:(p)ppGpp synthase/HD superfamily hydrolase
MPLTQIIVAIQYAREKHRGQKDDSGLDYFKTHIEQVAGIVTKVTNDHEIIAAAYLHDTIEDTDATYEEIKAIFGTRIADLVVELTKVGDKKTGYTFPNLKSRDAIIIKFADRLSNLSRMEPWDQKRQDQYIRKSKFWRSE